MNIKLTNKDKQNIAKELNSIEFRYRSLIKNVSFNVGDILVQRTMEFDADAQNIESDSVTLYENSIIPKRFLVIYADSNTGTFLAKPFDLKGKPETDLISLNDVDNAAWSELIYYQVDPIAIDSILLGEEYDLASVFAKESVRRANIIEMKRKSSVVFNNLKAVNKFIKNLKLGQTIYYHRNTISDFNSDYVTEFEFRKIRKVRRKEFAKTKRGCNFQGNDSFVFYMRCKIDNALITSDELINKVIYIEEPIKLAEER
jgi:hypothetical protein